MTTACKLGVGLYLYSEGKPPYLMHEWHWTASDDES